MVKEFHKEPIKVLGKETPVLAELLLCSFLRYFDYLLTSRPQLEIPNALRDLDIVSEERAKMLEYLKKHSAKSKAKWKVSKNMKWKKNSQQQKRSTRTSQFLSSN